MTTQTTQPTIILIAGHWLGAWAWEEVVEHLSAAGRHAVPLTLPGLDNADPHRASRTLDDQVVAIWHAMDQAGASAAQPVVIVAHSGANAPVSIVLDQCPERVRRVVWVDSGPVATGTVFAPDLPEEITELPLPPFEILQKQASIEGLSDEILEQFRARAVPEPAPVLRQAVNLSNEARLHVSTTIVCCSMLSTQMMELAQAGHPVFAEVANLIHLDLVDLPTGHWPMWSRPKELAHLVGAR